MEERTGGARAGPWALDWGRVVTGRLRGGLVGPSHSPARSAPWREAPPLRSSAPRHAPVAPVRPHAAPVKDGSLTASLTQTPRVLNCPSTAAPTAMWAARLETWWSARGHGRGSRPGVDHGEGRASKGLRRPLDGSGRTASVILEIVPALRSTPIVDARWWPMPRTVMPGRIKPMDHPGPGSPGSALSPCATRRGAERARPAPWAATGPEEPHLRGRRSWPHSRSSCWDAPTEPTRPLPQFQMIGQLSGQPAFQGHSSSEAGSRPSVPVITGPCPNRSARTSRPTPHRNTTAPPHPRPPTPAITPSVTTYRSSQIKGNTQTTEHAPSVI